MDAPVRDPQGESIPDLVTRLIEDSRIYARAEADLLKQIARHRAERAKSGMIALAAGAVLLLSSLTALILGTVMAVATLVGPLLAGILVAAALAAGGYFLVRSGLVGVQALGGDEDEKKALVQGETVR